MAARTSVMPMGSDYQEQIARVGEGNKREWIIPEERGIRGRYLLQKRLRRSAWKCPIRPRRNRRRFQPARYPQPLKAADKPFKNGNKRN